MAETEVDEESEQRWTDLGAFIREQRETMHLSLRKLSELADVSNPYLSQIERGLRRPSAEILQQIGRALEISSETLYVRAGILDEDAVEVDVEGEIRRDPALTEEHKRILCSTYRALRDPSAESLEQPVDAADEPGEAVPDDDSAGGAGTEKSPNKKVPNKKSAAKKKAPDKKSAAKKSSKKAAATKKTAGAQKAGSGKAGSSAKKSSKRE